ncbi:GNAT family N-acetyltransferase [Methanococcus aeolicus]|uniref:GNAT family N-acetyltransferase n=1 Tax=Methanococcus aeolicus TaxID=42879 RepID=UPI0021C5C7C3|nr:GNAT family N-acetyltransferase [Methanococcus aeolicus]UXM84769.1 GNAT family N-acetyltransferase [Methanococcus aeolicus]
MVSKQNEELLTKQQAMLFRIYDLYKKFENEIISDKPTDNVKVNLTVDHIVDVDYVDKVQEILLSYSNIWGFVHKSSIKQWIIRPKTIRIVGIFDQNITKNDLNEYNDLIGVMVYGEKPSYLKINYIAVDKKNKDNTLGKYFISFLENRGIEMEKRKIYAEVPESNENGLRFFVKNGFVIEGILKNHTRGNKDLVLMAKYIGW